MANWIRVDTHISRDPRLTRARRILQVDTATMVGHYVLLEAELAVQRPSGELRGIRTEILAEWAGYDGDPATFRKAIAVLTDGGKLAGWDETQGKRIEYLENERERKRADRERRKKAREERRTGAAPGADSPQDVRGTAADVRRYGTLRYDTVRDGTVPHESVPEESVVDRPEQLERASDARENAADADARSPVASPIHDNGKGHGHAPALGPTAIALLERVFPDDALRGAKTRELLQTLSPEGAPFDGAERARAVDVVHLDAACTAVMAMVPKLRKPSSVLRLVFLKLRDTYQERRGALEAVALGKANGKRGGPAKPIGEVLVPVADERDAAIAERDEALQWAAEHEPAAESINRRLQKEFNVKNPHSPSYRSMLISAFVEAMREERRIANEAASPNGRKRSTTAAAAAGGA